MNSLKYYNAGNEYNTYEKHIPAPYIRKSFNVEKICDVVKSELLVSSEGFYELYVNGRNITKGILAPYISNPDDIVYFDTYQLDFILREGENVIGLILGNGMKNAHGGRVWDFDIASFRGAPSFTLKLSVTYSDGKTLSITADESFKCKPSPIIFDDLRSGCFYDANKEIPCWFLPGYDDTDWKNVVPADCPRGERRICQAEPVTVNCEISPVSVSKAKLCNKFDNRSNMRLDTEFKFNFRGEEGIMFDFGVNSAGIFRLRIDGRKGQRIFIQFCEHLSFDNEPFYANTGSFYPDGYGQTAYYVCKGEKAETFVPSFTYYGYRYAVVFGLDDEQIKDDTLVMLRANSSFDTVSDFECSDETMNRLSEMSKVSDLANFYYFPTDCPHREKNGWTGDAAVSAEHILLRYTPEKSYKEWLRNICKAQLKDGRLPGIIPTGGWGFEWGNGPAWDNVLTELCYQIYRFKGDLSAAVECSDAMLSYLNYLSKNRLENGLVALGLGDWLQPGKGAGDPTAPLYVTDSIISMYIARKSYILFRALGYSRQADFADSLYVSLKNAIRNSIIDFSTMTVLPRCQTCQAMSIYYGVFEKSEIKSATDVLVEIINESGNHFDCGMLGLRVIFHVLSASGYGDLAYKMITRQDYPSYGMLIRRGLTSLAEDFISDEEWENDRVNSLNHHFMGDIYNWFVKNVVGLTINPDDDNIRRIDLHPDFITGLTFADGYYVTAFGKISVSWKKENNEYSLEVQCPDEISGKIYLHNGFRFLSNNTRDSLHNSSVTELKSGLFRIRKI